MLTGLEHGRGPSAPAGTVAGIVDAVGGAPGLTSLPAAPVSSDAVPLLGGSSGARRPVTSCSARCGSTRRAGWCSGFCRSFRVVDGGAAVGRAVDGVARGSVVAGDRRGSRSSRAERAWGCRRPDRRRSRTPRATSRARAELAADRRRSGVRTIWLPNRPGPNHSSRDRSPEPLIPDHLLPDRPIPRSAAARRDRRALPVVAQRSVARLPAIRRPPARPWAPRRCSARSPIRRRRSSPAGRCRSSPSCRTGWWPGRS